jgi:hypothetical protein
VVSRTISCRLLLTCWRSCGHHCSTRLDVFGPEQPRKFVVRGFGELPLRGRQAITIANRMTHRVPTSGGEWSELGQLTPG